MQLGTATMLTCSQEPLPPATCNKQCIHPAKHMSACKWAGRYVDRGLINNGARMSDCWQNLVRGVSCGLPLTSATATVLIINSSCAEALGQLARSPSLSTDHPTDQQTNGHRHGSQTEQSIRTKLAAKHIQGSSWASSKLWPFSKLPSCARLSPSPILRGWS